MKKALSLILAVVLIIGIVPLVNLDLKTSAASFTPRLTAPERSGYYGTQNEYNPFRTNSSAGNGNCTWYAWGRAYEILGSRPQIGTGNASTWYGTSSAYAHGSAPKLGAIACWAGGSTGAGHVAVVEQIKDNGTIVISESSWSATTWWFRTQTINSNGYYGSSLSFQGYIYLGDFSSVPAEPVLSLNKDRFTTGENIVLSFSNIENTTTQYLQITNQTTGNMYYDGYITGVTTHYQSFNEPGTYLIAYQTSNSSGLSNVATKSFIVYNTVPAKPKLWFDRDTIASGSVITIHRWSELAKYYSMSIYKNGVLITNNQDSYGVYSAILSSEGEYKVVAGAINEYGESEYAEAYFWVYNSVPDKPAVWMEQTAIKQGTEFTIFHWSKYAMSYSVSIYKDGSLIQNEQPYTGSSQVTLNVAGDYKIVASAVNEYGESEYSEAYFSIVSNIPDAPLLWVDNEYIPLGTDVVIHRWAEAAKFYSTSIYKNGSFVLNNQDSWGLYSVNLSEAGDYKIVTQAINDYGGSGFSEAYFTIYNTAPKSPNISTNQLYYAINENITVNIANSSIAKEAYLTVRNESTGEAIIGPGLRFTQPPDCYSFGVVSEGKYCIEYQTVNEFGSSDCVSAKINIVDDINLDFDLNGGVGTTNRKIVSYNATYGDLPTPTREGYNFEGWYTEESGGDLVTSETIVTATADHTLYAHWSRFGVKEGSTAVIDGNYIYGLKTNLTAANIKNNFLDFEGVEVTLTKAIEGARYYGTGSTITVKYADGTEKTYTIIIFGDVDGNAIIDGDDAYATLAAAVDNSLFDAVQKKAANVDGVRRISVDDYAIINDAVLGISDIDQTAIV